MKLRVLFICLALLFSGWLLSSQVAHADESPVGDTLSNGSGNGADGGSGSDDGGGGDGSGNPGVGGGEVPAQTGSSVPRIMLTAFTTEPNVVKAGESFRIHFTVQNMSRTSRVNNIKITVSGGEGGGILPSSGSSSTYISTIRPEYSVSREMDFRTMTALEEGPHQLTLNIEYEDADFNQLQSQEAVSVIVEQETRADTGTIQVMPDYISVGQDASLSFSVNNMGKTKLFNARATIKEGQPITGQESFIGTIEPGASGTVDLMVSAHEANYDPVVVVISYESESGEVTSLEKSFDLTVEEFVEEPEEPWEEPWEEEPQPSLVSSTNLMVLGGLLLLALIVIILVVRRRRKRAKASLDDDMALLDGDPLVPADPK